MSKKRWKNNRLMFFILGLSSLLWFLIRVIPKPQRAFYPCQRTAFPIASAFIIWLINAIAPLAALTNIIYFIRRKRKNTWITATLICTALVGIMFYTGNMPDSFAKYSETQIFVASDSANNPIGLGKGINPARVVWMHDPEATSWDGASEWWWDDSNNNQSVIDTMAKNSLLWITGLTQLQPAWDSIFQHFNHEKRGVHSGYTAGEKIAIKVNMNTCSEGTITAYRNNESKTSPHLLLAYVKQLIDIVGVAPSDITIYDKSKRISDEIYEKLTTHYANLQFVDNWGQKDKPNWNKYEVNYESEVHWSENLILEKEGGNPTYLPVCVSEADYLINIGNLRGHNLAGVTMNAKNHFGTFYSYSERYNYYGPKAAGVHPYIAVHDFGNGCGGTGKWDFCGREMGTYNALVDIMGHENLGGKTLLYILDALYCAISQVGNLPSKWISPPFNNDWTSSIFLSMDGVAIESVGLDFLAAEPTQTYVFGNVDNYLHEAALADQPASGIVYDPEKDGIPLQSIGVHEHWNNAYDKQYSRNLGIARGIELVSSFPHKLHKLDVDKKPGNYSEPISVELLIPSAETEAYYTLDGSEPTHHSTLYNNAPINIERTVNLKVKLFKSGFLPSEVFEFSYQIQNTTSLLELAKPAFSVYPNPVVNEIFFQLSGEWKPAVMMVFTTNGRILKKEGFNRSTRSMNLRGLPPGNYILQLSDGKKVLNKRFLKVSDE